MRGFIVIIIISMTLFLPFCGSSQGELICEPSEFNIDLVQGEEIQRKITLSNNNNTTISGHIWVVNVKCGLECPNAHLSIKESELIELGPQESTKATIYISSHLFNEPQEITLPIEFYIDGHENKTTVAEIHITVHTNYGIYLGIPLIIIVIIVVLIIVYIKKIKPRKLE
jgi:hypothetical protein